MANTCEYLAHIEGKKQNVIDFFHWLYGTGPKMEVAETNEKGEVHHRIAEGFVGRIGHDNSTVRFKTKNGKMFAEIDDYCAWSVQTAALNSNGQENRKSISDLANELSLKIEIYSVEYGVGFDEHYYFDGDDPSQNMDYEYDHDGISDALEDRGYKFDEDECEWRDEDGNVVENAVDIIRQEEYPWDFDLVPFDFSKFNRLALDKFVEKFHASWDAE